MLAPLVGVVGGVDGVGAGACAGACPLQYGAGVDWAGRLRTEKTPAHIVSPGFLGSPSRLCVWHHDGAHVDAKRRCLHQQAEVLLPVHDRMGFAEIQLGHAQAHASRSLACISS